MKNIYLLLLMCTTLVTQAQLFFYEVAGIPLTGIEYLQVDNPYILQLRADTSASGWTPSSRQIRTKAPNTQINYPGYQLTSSWTNNTWEDNYEVTDSFVLDSQQRIQAVFEHTYYNYPGFQDETKTKREFSYSSDKKIATIKYFQTPNLNSNNYIKQWDTYILYDMEGNRIKDSTRYAGGQYSTVKHYTYSNIGLLSQETELNGTDTISKVIYGFITSPFDGMELITARLEYSYNNTTDEVTLIAADSIDYFNDYTVSYHISYGLIFSNGNYSIGPYRYDSYSYEDGWKLTKIISRLFTDGAWNESLMTEIEYSKNKAEVGYIYPFIGGGWSNDPVFKLLFSFNTGLTANLTIPDKGITCYPNPATSTVTIESNSNTPLSLCELYDFTGKQIASFPDITTTNTIDISNYPEGIYYLRVQNSFEQTVTHKLAIAR